MTETMLTEQIKNIKSGKKELKEFGITIGVILMLIGILLTWRYNNYYPLIFIFSVILLFLAFVLPSILKPFHKIWMSLALIIGWVMTRVILSILFYFIITPIGFLTKLLRKDFLNIKFDKDAHSYWISRGDIKIDKKNYENQF